MVGYDELTTCSHCGKPVYGFELVDHLKQTCINCEEMREGHPILYRLEGIKGIWRKSIRAIRKYSKQKHDNVLPFIWVLSAAVAIICGVLECFGIRTGIIGVLCAVISSLPIPLLLAWGICCFVLRLIFPGWEKEKVGRVSVYVLVFIIVNLLWAAFV